MKWWLSALLALATGCVHFHPKHLTEVPEGSQFITVEGVRLRVSDQGEGPAVVLIHGFASSYETWDLLTPELSKTHRVICLDLAGFGYSDRQEGDYYAPESEARLILGVLDQLGVQETAVVGHSFGASVSLALALTAPDRITRIALYDAWVYSEQLPQFFHWARIGGIGELLFGMFYDQLADERLSLAFYRPDDVPEELIEKVEASLQRPGTFAAALASARGQTFEVLEKSYRNIKKPVLLLWGREDRVSTVKVAERLAGELGGAKLVIYPRTGHFPMLEVPTASNRELIAFLTEAGHE